jgi:hypothetical protein
MVRSKKNRLNKKPALFNPTYNKAALPLNSATYYQKNKVWDELAGILTGENTLFLKVTLGQAE